MERHGFDFTSAIRCLCADMIGRLVELQHIDLERVAINLCQTRKDVKHGLYASLTPLRFEDGAVQKKLRGRRYSVDRVCNRAGQEYLYILSFYLPRFMNTPVEEKLSTIIHELWHISPDFNGDLRRHLGRCYAHGPSQRDYDAQMDRLAQNWLALSPPEHLYHFLVGDFQELVVEYGKVTGAHWPAPKLVPL
mgnify:CR=1 FL=1